MSAFLQSLATFNSLLRTVIVLGLLGGAGTAGWLGWHTYRQAATADRQRAEQLAAAERQLEEQQQRIVELQSTVHEQLQEIQRLTAANRLLKLRHRIAQLSVLDQYVDEQTGELISDIEFVEVNEEGAPISAPKRLQLSGDLVYLDNWVVKFEDKYVEQSDLDRGTSIVLFRRIFGEHQRPIDGFALEDVGTMPTSYARGGQLSELETQIWQDFWDIANDRQRAAELGIRAAHGEAVSVRLREGSRYRIELRASDGLSIIPE